MTKSPQTLQEKQHPNLQFFLSRNIWAVGRNYADHASEMKVEVPDKKKHSPLFFLKAGSSLTTSSRIQLPTWSREIHHEIELAYLIDENMQFSHITLALDLTARDAQNVAKEKGQPWTLAKSFTNSCPIGNWISLAEIDQQKNLEFDLSVNNQVAQIGSFSDMIFNPSELLDFAKKHYPLIPHDIILTGTPSGVGLLTAGDTLVARLWDSTSAHQNILTQHWDVE
jgi:acylpyruvate hydrolase